MRIAILTILLAAVGGGCEKTIKEAKSPAASPAVTHTATVSQASPQAA